MYVPPHFSETRPELLHALIRDYPLATLITQSGNGVVADHLPLQFVTAAGRGLLRGHVARANPVWHDRANPDAEVLAVFTGPQAYITPSWYATKAETGRVVPTWNYTAVHVRGPMRAVHDAQWLRTLLESLTVQQEATVPSQWQVGDAPTDYVERMLEAIVGIEIEISTLSGKWKVSQNQPAANRAGVIAGLEACGNDPAQAMARLIPDG